MKTTFRLLSILSMVAALASCQQFKIDTQMTPEKMKANAKLVCDAADSYTLSAENPESIVFNVSANTPWSISGATEWLKVTPASSAASSLIEDVTVTAQPNTNLEDREAVLTIKSEGYPTGSYTVKIKQARKGKLFVLPVAKDFIAAGGELPFSIETNQAWEVRSDAMWLTFGVNHGNGDGKPMVIMAIAEPSDVFERKATVTVTTADGQVEEFEVCQKAVFSVIGNDTEFDEAGGTLSFKLKTDLPWIASCDASWVNIQETDGVGDGSIITITATVAANTGATRSTVINIEALGEKKTIAVSQKGISFNIVKTENTMIDGLGGELTFEVNTTLDWTVAVDNANFAAEKVDATHFKVTATKANTIFKPIEFKATIAAGGNTDSIDLTQDVNFTFENCEILEDGSVKLSASKVSKVYLKGDLRIIDLKLELGDKNFGQKANFWVMGKCPEESGSVCLYNWVDIGTNVRVRSEGTLVATGETSYYKSTSYSLSPDILNATTNFEWKISTNEDDQTKLDMVAVYDGQTLGSQSGLNPFTADPDVTFTYYFGFYKEVSDGTWFVVKNASF